MKNSGNRVSIILAAGKGTRMGSSEIPKVCYPIHGRPAVVRLVDQLEAEGVHSHCVVVGYNAFSVMEALEQADADHLVFCNQVEQKGTGHAAGIALHFLKSLNYSGEVLITAGDKVLQDGVFQRLSDTFYQEGCDFAFAVSPKAGHPDSGCIIEDSKNHLILNLEKVDYNTLLFLEDCLSQDEMNGKILMQRASKRFGESSKGYRYLTKLLPNPERICREDLAKIQKRLLTLYGKEISMDSLRSCRYVNQSVYMAKALRIYEILDSVQSSNSQNEFYLTDIIGLLSASGKKVLPVLFDQPGEIMAFNTPEEHQAIEKFYAGETE